MDRQSTIAFILIGVILVFWLYLNSPDPQKLPQQKADSTLVSTEENKIQKKEAEAEKLIEPVTEFKTEEEVVTSDIPEKIITIETNLALLEISSKGARIKKFFLKKYKTWYHNLVDDTTNFYNTHVQLINTSKDGGDFNIVYVTREGKLVNTKTLDFELDNFQSYYKIPKNDSLNLAFVYKAGDNKSLSKEFVFYGSNYNSKVDIVLNNMNDLISSYRYDLIWANGINFVEENSVDEANFSSAAAYSGDEKVVIDATSVDDPAVS